MELPAIFDPSPCNGVAGLCAAAAAVYFTRIINSLSRGECRKKIGVLATTTAIFISDLRLIQFGPHPSIRTACCRDYDDKSCRGKGKTANVPSAKVCSYCR